MKNNLMKNFDGEKVAQECVDWIRKYAKENNMKKVVLGISGGKDSTVAAMLCCEALGKENVIGVLMPNEIQYDIKDSYYVCDKLEIKTVVINISDQYNSTIDNIEDAEIRITNEAKINIAPRIRMMTLYTIAQSIGARVCGTGNLSERTIGYCTKWGDMASDFNPIGNLTSLEVVEIGLALAEKYGINEQLIVKVPSDGLCGQTDEERLGITYEDIHKYIRGYDVEFDSYVKIEKLEDNAQHKLNLPPMFMYTGE